MIMKDKFTIVFIKKIPQIFLITGKEDIPELKYACETDQVIAYTEKLIA